ncbi:MAG: DUF86 domain-containing protein [Myxococcales bacterium]|nr:DUF86 domain-containing protein [Myxococcales bacterium]
MVDRDIVTAKVAAVVHHLARLRAKLPLSRGALAESEDLRNTVYFDLIQAIQGCIDLAVHACAHESLGAPEGLGAAFGLLATHGLIDTDLSIRLAAAAGLRNLIVHRYAEIEDSRVLASLEAGLGDMERFADAMRRRAMSAG